MAPDESIALDSRTVKGLAHPLRVRLLGLLREHGPATATGLARRVGESSGVTSYHLRQLADYGFVEEDPDRGNGRERWWRARHRTTVFDPFHQDGAAGALGQEYLRSVAQAQGERMLQAVDSVSTYVERFGPAWTEGTTLSDALLWLSADQAAALVGELDALAERYGRLGTGPGPGRERVVFQYQVLPQDRQEETS